jgi:DNA polymerase I-like protein with 3'-5' exonuclease and polymerase domains
MYKADTDVLAEYCCWDVLLTIMLFHKYQDKLEKEGLLDFFYEEEVMPLYKLVTINMKRRGFPVDMSHFQKLKSDLEVEIVRLEDEIISDIKPDIEKFEQTLLNEEAPIKNTGNYPKILAEVLGVPLPVTPNGKVTLAAKAIAKQKAATPVFANFYDWLSGSKTIEEAIPTGLAQTLYSSLDSEIDDPVMEARKRMYFSKAGDSRHIFNLRSNHHLKAWLVDIKGHKPIEKTDKGAAKIDDDFLWFIRDAEPMAYKLMDFKQLNKLLSTYVEGILERQINGIIYTSMLQFGTTSGRYSSRNPNLQNLPKPVDPKEAQEAGISPLVLKYLNNIRKGFIAGVGRKLVDADYNALEPRCFAHMSGDETLRNVFRNGEDLYSRVAIDVFAIPNVSAFKKDANYLGNVSKEKRQKSKVFCLAVPYGAEEARIAEAMNVKWDEAGEIIANYLNAYPNLKKYMAQCNREAKAQGYVKTEFGRVRHLQRAKDLYDMYGDKLLDWKWAKREEERLGLPYTKLRREYKNCLNNAKNFKIQGLAAHIVNRSMIALAKAIKEEGLDAYIALQVHDQVIVIAAESCAERVRQLMKRCLENTITISLPLPAEPAIADNMADSH